MGLGRGVLARVDRRLLAGLGGEETWRMVRVPTTPVMWSTWKRYCDAAGVSMGRAIAALIGHELAGVLDNTGAGDSPVVADQGDEELARREMEVTRRDQEAVEDRLRVWEVELRRRERDLEARERRAAAPADSPMPPGRSRGRVGRNELCPCGSGRKYKRCHGAPTRQRRGGSGTDGLMG